MLARNRMIQHIDIKLSELWQLRCNLVLLVFQEIIALKEFCVQVQTHILATGRHLNGA